MMRVLVTQADESGRLSAVLRARGAEVWNVPTIRIAPPDDWHEADEALKQWSSFGWVVFTSANTVRAVWERLKLLGVNADDSVPRVAAVGRATAATIQERGWPVDCVPAEYRGDALAAALVGSGPLRGVRVLFPKGDLAREVVPEALRSAGAEVVEIVVYRTVPADVDAAGLRSALCGGAADALTFTSPSTVTFFVRSVGANIWDAMPESVVVASIGPTTTAALKDSGRPPDCQAAEATVDALADAVMSALQEIKR